jgi:histidinol phosphatase-like enzyme
MEALKMETPMDRWNDDRLDELSRRMDDGFKQVNADMKEGFAQMDQRFAQMDQRFERMDQRFESVDQKFDRLLHTLALISWGVAGTLFAALISVLVAILI